MNTTNPTVIIIGAVVLLVIIALIGMAMTRARRTKQLQERFGPEYDKTIDEVGDKRRAERHWRSGSLTYEHSTSDRCLPKRSTIMGWSGRPYRGNLWMSRWQPCKKATA